MSIPRRLGDLPSEAVHLSIKTLDGGKSSPGYRQAGLWYLLSFLADPFERGTKTDKSRDFRKNVRTRKGVRSLFL